MNPPPLLWLQDGKTAYDYAVQRGHTDVIQLLQQVFADLGGSVDRSRARVGSLGGGCCERCLNYDLGCSECEKIQWWVVLLGKALV